MTAEVIDFAAAGARIKSRRLAIVLTAAAVIALTAAAWLWTKGAQPRAINGG